MKSSFLQFGLIFLLAATAACSAGRKASKEVVKGPVGVWDALVAGTPMGDIPVEIVFIQEGDTYSGMVNAETEKMKINNLKIEEGKITGSFYAPSYGQDIYFDAAYISDTDTIEGWIMNEFKLTGKRKAADGM